MDWSAYVGGDRVVRRGGQMFIALGVELADWRRDKNQMAQSVSLRYGRLCGRLAGRRGDDTPLPEHDELPKLLTTALSLPEPAKKADDKKNGRQVR